MQEFLQWRSLFCFHHWESYPKLCTGMKPLRQKTSEWIFFFFFFCVCVCGSVRVRTHAIAQPERSKHMD